MLTINRKNVCIMGRKQTEDINISFKKLGDLLEKKGKKWQYLRDNGISPGIVAKMKDGTGHTDTRTIQKVCEILNCQPGQIMEYISPAKKTINVQEPESKEPELIDDDIPDFMRD